MMKLTLTVLILLMMTTGLALAGPVSSVPAASDSLGNYWGLRPSLHDSTTAHFQDQPLPGWEKVALVPYHLLGLPFRILNITGSQTFKTLDNWGIFDMPPAEYAGLVLPFGIYLLPEGGITGHEGISYGFNLRKPKFLGPENLLFLTLSTSTRHADIFGGGAYFQMNRRLGLQLGAGLSDRPMTYYYGLGYNSSEAGESFFNRISKWAGAELDYDLGRCFGVELRSFFSKMEARNSRFEQDEGLALVHAGNLPYGYPGKSRGWSFKAQLVHNGTEETGRAQGQGFQKAGISWFQGTDDQDLSFLQYSFDVQHFVPLWFTKRTLGLRAFGAHISNQGTSEIPFYRLSTMYRPYSMRGLSNLRYYGMGNIGFSAEYRWPLWVAKGREDLGMDAYVFTDIGQVFDHRSDIALDHLKQTAGLGVRFIGSEGKYLGRFEIGFSDEETTVSLTFSQTFQHHSKGLLYGNDPTKRP